MKYFVAQNLVTLISTLVLTGVTEPVAKQAPDTSAVCSAEGLTTGTPTINWSPTVSGTFNYSTIYTATIVLQSASGFVFADSGSVTIDGSAPTSVTGWGTSALTLTKTYPATAVDPLVYIPSGGLILWGGTTAPAGWAFNTVFDDCLVLGGTYNATLMGALTHIHTHPGMATNGGHNNHAYVVANASGAQQATVKAFDNAEVVATGHTHVGGTGSGQSTSGAHTHTVPNTNSASNLPLYVRLRWISGATAIPVGGIVMKLASTDLPAGFVICNGANGTPDMTDRFVYGGSGGNGGLKIHGHTSSGSTSSNGDHTHTGIAITSGSVSGSNGGSSYNPAISVATGHNHSASNLTSGAANPNTHSHTVGNTSSDTVEPPYITAYFVMRIS